MPTRRAFYGLYHGRPPQHVLESSGDKAVVTQIQRRLWEAAGRKLELDKSSATESIPRMLLHVFYLSTVPR